MSRSARRPRRHRRRGAAAACVMVFNASDPSGAGGLAGDVTAIASVGAHALPVVTGAYARDTAEIFDHFPSTRRPSPSRPAPSWRTCRSQVIKVGFVGSPESDQRRRRDRDRLCRRAGGRLHAQPLVVGRSADRPVPRRLPRADAAADHRAGGQPQHAVALAAARLEQRRAAPARATSPRPPPKMGVPYTLVTGIPLPDQFIDNVLATPQGGAGQREIRALRGRVLRRRRHAVGRAGGAGGQRHRPRRRHHRGAGLPGPLPRRGLPPRHGPRACPTACSGPSPRARPRNSRRGRARTALQRPSTCPPMTPSTDAA